MGLLSYVTLVFSLITFGNSAKASQVSCEDTISMAVTNVLAEQKSTEVVNGSPIAVKFLETTALYVASSASEYGATKTKWAVLVKLGPQSTCEVINVVQDSKLP